MREPEKVARLYAGGDNLWKGYGYEFFKSDFAAAFKNVDDVANYFKIHNHPFSRKDLITGAVKSFDEALDEAAAFMLRNTYPTYSKVPPAIQGLRNIPFFGNFVSFPAEMLRTGTLSLAMSLKNIASGNPVLRQMGYRNLMGGYLAVKGIGQAAHVTANTLTGNTQEQWASIHVQALLRGTRTLILLEFYHGKMENQLQLTFHTLVLMMY